MALTKLGNELIAQSWRLINTEERCSSAADKAGTLPALSPPEI
ncbi:hypothetical protein [Paenarthrobacter ureafaciens]|nr:hypothetical protein [Paenarthrobacter ureafaciens]